MRIGIDASAVRSGGGVTHLVEILNALHPEDFGISRVTVWTNSRTLAKLPRRTWLELCDEPLLNKPLPYRVFWQRFRLPRLAKSECDILYLPNATYSGGFRPYVGMGQNLLPFDVSERRRFRYSWPYLRYRLLALSQSASLRNASGVIFLTNAAKRVILKQIGNLRGEKAIIPHGIADRFRKTPSAARRESFETNPRVFKCLYVSIVNLYKHQWHVCEAIASLRKQGYSVELDLVGPAYPPALKKLNDTISRLDPNGDFIRYRSAVPYADLDEVYHSSDLFIFASSCENMPNILGEAMASGLPIACSNRGPMPEVLKDAGVYFDPEKPEEIANAVRRLMDSSELRRTCASRAYQYAAEYSWERCAAETFSFLARVGGANVAEPGVQEVADQICDEVLK